MAASSLPLPLPFSPLPHPSPHFSSSPSPSLLFPFFLFLPQFSTSPPPFPTPPVFPLFFPFPPLLLHLPLIPSSPIPPPSFPCTDPREGEETWVPWAGQWGLWKLSHLLASDKHQLRQLIVPTHPLWKQPQSPHLDSGFSSCPAQLPFPPQFCLFWSLLLSAPLLRGPSNARRAHSSPTTPQWPCPFHCQPLPCTL